MGIDAKWRFCVVANVKESHIGGDGKVYYGSKAFRPRTKIFLYHHIFKRDNCYNIGAIGRNRYGRLVDDHLPVELVENIRVQRIYKPSVLNIMEYLEAMEGNHWWGSTAEDRKAAEEFVKNWKTASENWENFDF